MQSGERCHTLCTFTIAWMGLKNAGRRQVASSTGHLDEGRNSYTLVTVFPLTLHSPVQVGIQISSEKWKWVARLSVYGIGVCVYLKKKKKRMHMLGCPESSFGIFCKMLTKNWNKISGQCNMYVSPYIQQLYILRKKSEAVNNKQSYQHNWFS